MKKEPFSICAMLEVKEGIASVDDFDLLWRYAADLITFQTLKVG